MLQEATSMPSVLGKSTYDAVKLLSDRQLHTRIVAEREDATLAAGTVISQNPAPEQTIKAQQPVFLVISKKPPVSFMPKFIGLTEKEAQKNAEKQHIALKKIYIPYNTVPGICFAQVPEPGTVAQKDVLVYISQEFPSYYIMPDCTGLPTEFVENFFKEKDIPVQVFSANGREIIARDSVVLDQRPHPGRCVDLKKGFTVQLSVS